jgi:hypothetical protein
MVASRTRSLAEARSRSRVTSPRGEVARGQALGRAIATRAPQRATGAPALTPGAMRRGAPAIAVNPRAGRSWLAELGFTAPAPWWLWAGLALNIAAWVSSWNRVGPWAYTFFPLWFGFILVLDGLNVTRGGGSLLSRDWRRFALLFPISSVFWWIFEWMNGFVHNWIYLYDHNYTPLGHLVISTLYFSTVLPAVMEMFELLATIPALKPLLPAGQLGPRLTAPWAARLLLVGIALLWLPITFPQYAYMLIWFCLIFLLDPINNLAGKPSAFARLQARDWKFLLTLPLAGLLCGFFWEMWNFYALPKWQYFLPYLNWTPHYFEMPIPGLLGYLPFAFELFAMYQFSLLLLGARRDSLAY